MTASRFGRLAKSLKALSTSIVLALSISATETSTHAAEANAASLLPQSRAKLQAFRFEDVRLLDGPFKTAMGRDTEYLLSLEPDRLLSKFMTEAGLEPRAKNYGGWDAEGVAGCILGHYLSACSMAYASTGDQRFKQRVDAIVDQLAICQDKIGNGYVGAIPDWRDAFENIKARRGKMVGWVPWYTMHKYLAGLRDAYVHGGDEKAKQVLVRLADWVGKTIDPLTDPEVQVMLQAEQGGMSEVLADVAAITGDARYLAMARRFTHRAVIDPLAAGLDRLDGLHANTQIPKLIGAARIYALTGDAYYGRAADTFWTTVTTNRTWAIGGNGDAEAFFPPALAAQHLSGITAETCNVYNMVKLTNAEFALDPRPACADYVERALFNQILGSQDPKRGMFTYHQSLRPGGFRIYSDPENAMWCCVGTGMENHVRYGESIYFHDDANLYVNLFVASRVEWKEKGLTLTQQTTFPDEPSTRFTVTCDRPTEAAIRLRVPYWIAATPTIRVNGEVQSVPATADTYAALTRTWHDGDTIDYAVPMNVHVETLSGSDREVALEYGPVVLAADLGTKGLEAVHFYEIGHRETAYARFPTVPVPALVGHVDELARHVQPVEDDLPLTFKTVGLGHPDELTFRPYARTHFVRYAVYLKAFPDTASYDAERAKIDAIDEAKRQLDARTTDAIKPGEQQPEVDHQLKSELSHFGDFQDLHWRDAGPGGFFEYAVRVSPDEPMQLVCTYWGGDRGNRNFDVLVDGQRVATQRLENEKPGEIFDVTYPIPAALTRGKSSVVLRFAGTPGSVAGGVMGIRLVTASAAK